MSDFKNRQSDFPNRRRIIIQSQGENEMIADIEYADNATNTGTAINADIFNNFSTDITNSLNKATNALNNSNNALNKANSAIENSTLAITKSNNAYDYANEAIQISNLAKEKSEEVMSNIANSNGTKVLIGNNTDAESSINFTSDPQTQINGLVKINQGTANANNNLIIDSNGNVKSSNYIYIGGNIKISKSTNTSTGQSALVFEF